LDPLDIREQNKPFQKKKKMVCVEGNEEGIDSFQQLQGEAWAAGAFSWTMMGMELDGASGAGVPVVFTTGLEE